MILGDQRGKIRKVALQHYSLEQERETVFIPSTAACPRARKEGWRDEMRFVTVESKGN